MDSFSSESETSSMNTPLKVLVVDDHPAIRSTMSDILDAEGFRPSIARNGQEAIQKCKEQEFDFILMDLQMPDINGFEVIKKLKREDLSSAKFIVITAYSIPELEEQVNQLGIHAFLKKPIKVEAIINLIRGKSRISVLVNLLDDHMRNGVINLLANSGYQVVEAKEHDRALIQLRQIDYDCLIFDSDSHANEQEALLSTIKNSKSETFCVETNEDESPMEVLRKINRFFDD